MNDQRNRRFLAYFDSVNKIAVALGAVVALIGAIVSLAYLVWPNPPPPPPPRHASMTITDSFPARLIDYLLETGRDSSGYSDAALEQLGKEYYVKVRVDGLRNKSAEIVWNLRGQVSDLPISERKQWIHQFLTSFKPPADSYARIAKVWIPYPPFQGTFFAEIEIEFPEYETLVTRRTKRFAGRTTQPRYLESPAVRTTTTFMTIPASTTTEVTTIEGTTSVTTTIGGTTTTTTVPTRSTVTTTTTVPARTSTITRTVPIPSSAGGVPIVRPKARLVPP